MSNHPITDCMKTAGEHVANGNAVVFQKFTCAHCGSRQTIDTPNTFFTHGKCDECGEITDIREGGCNYVLHAASSPKGVLEFRRQYANVDTRHIVYADCTQWVEEHKGREKQ
jgi:hypothetical protein